MCCASDATDQPTGPDAECEPDDPRAECVPEDPSPALIDLRVIKNATQKHVRNGENEENWVCVKHATEQVLVEIETAPNDEATWRQVTWAGDGWQPVPGKRNQRSLSRAAAGKFPVSAELAGTTFELTVWVFWADLVLTMQTTDTLDPGNGAEYLKPDPNETEVLKPGPVWSTRFGGGNKLGVFSAEDKMPPIGHMRVFMTYAYTIGKMQAKATLWPAGIERVILMPTRTRAEKRRDRDKKLPKGEARASEEVGSYWRMRRNVTGRAFDNATLTFEPKSKDDTSYPGWQDLDPTEKPGKRELFDVDSPGCSATTDDFDEIDHTAEHYCNFEQYVTVILDSEVQCSDTLPWSYAAQVDIDKRKGARIEMNVVRPGHIVIPEKSKYKPRSP
jgi:hypothetical protein